MNLVTVMSPHRADGHEIEVTEGPRVAAMRGGISVSGQLRCLGTDVIRSGCDGGDQLFSPVDGQIYPEILQQTRDGCPDVLHHLEGIASNRVEVGLPVGNRLPDIQSRLGSSMADVIKQQRAILKGVEEKGLMIRTHGDDQIRCA